MSREELLAKLRALAESDDSESAHADADEALCQYIGDPEIEAAFDRIEKWYS